MSGEDEAGLDAIKGPATPPPSEPDRLAMGEVEKYRRPTPTDRLESANLALLNELRGQRDQLQEEVIRLRAAMDDMKPRYAALVESKRGLAEIGKLAATLVALGGLMLTLAGFLADATSRLLGIAVGSTTFLVGCWLQYRASTRAGGFTHDHLVEGVGSSPTDSGSVDDGSDRRQ
jgi:hypothetical protein